LMQQEIDRNIVTKDSIDAGRQQMLSDLGKLSGTAFDKAYINMMIANHQASLQVFSQAANSTDDAISKLAAAAIPQIQMHLDSAQAVLTSLK
jgi:putative membrane protein